MEPDPRRLDPDRELEDQIDARQPGDSCRYQLSYRDDLHVSYSTHPKVLPHPEAVHRPGPEKQSRSLWSRPQPAPAVKKPGCSPHRPRAPTSTTQHTVALTRGIANHKRVELRLVSRHNRGVNDSFLRFTAIAARQHGVVNVSQAQKVGLSWESLSRHVQNGVLLRPFEGVYVVSGSPATWERAVEVAVMASADSAVASHATACHLYGLARRPRTIEVTVPGTTRRTREWTIHRSTDLIPADVRLVQGIPTTKPARTMADVGIPWGGVFAGRCLDEAVRLGLTTDHEVAAVVHRVSRRGRNGVGPIRLVLMTRVGWAGLTDSQIESECVRILQAAGVDLPDPQITMRRKDGKVIARVDFVFREVMLVIQIDGWAYHSDRRSFRSDRRSQNAMVLEGYRVLRFTAFDVMAAPEYVVAQVLAALASQIRT